MGQLNLSVKDLAALTGLSRQTIHALLRPGFRPLVPSVDTVALALGIEASLLLEVASAVTADIPGARQLLDRAVAGDARSFELLPALLATSHPIPSAMILESRDTHLQLARAAAEVANTLAPSPPLEALANLTRTSGRCFHGFFFGADLMSPERIVQLTPEPLRKHLVFGAFAMADFARHL
jgi:transcriptional regulator with XRE-family HTH domain